MNRNYEFVVYKTFFKQWRWRIKADNGKIIGASTESFKNKLDCSHNAILVKNSIV